MGDKGDKNAARPPEGSLVETRCLIKGPKSAIVPFPGPRSGPKSRTGPGALAGWQRGNPRQRVSWYDVKQSDSEALALEIMRMWNTPLSTLLPGLLWLEVVAPDRVLCMGQIEQTVWKQTIDI